MQQSKVRHAVPRPDLGGHFREIVAECDDAVGLSKYLSDDFVYESYGSQPLRGFWPCVNLIEGHPESAFVASMPEMEIDTIYVDSAQLVVVVCGREIVVDGQLGVCGETHSVWIVHFKPDGLISRIVAYTDAGSNGILPL